MQKTEAVVLTNKKGYDRPSFELKGKEIIPTEQLKHKGVEMSRKLGFRAHFLAASARASKTALALSRILLNVGGSGEKKRRLLASVVHSQLLYTGPVWAGSLKFTMNGKVLLRPQRTMALKVAMTYRMVSTEAMLVVASIIPAHLQAREKTVKYKRRDLGTESNKDIRKDTFT